MHFYITAHPPNNKSMRNGTYDGKSAMERLTQNCRKHHMKFRKPTPSDGNCFFHAVSDQLTRLGIHPVLSHQKIRADLISYMKRTPKIKVNRTIIDYMFKLKNYRQCRLHVKKHLFDYLRIKVKSF